MCTLSPRLLKIEKKIAAGQRLNTKDPTGQNRGADDTYEEGAETLLLKTPQDQAYIIPQDQSRVMKAYPILHCFKDGGDANCELDNSHTSNTSRSLDATVPTVAEEYYGFISLQTGLLFIPIVLPMLIIGPVAGWMTDRQGSRIIAISGFGLLGPLLMLLRAVHPGGLDQVLIYCLLLTLCGTCLATTNPPALVESMLMVEKYHKANPEVFGPNGPYAQTSSVTGFMYNAGSALGPLLAGDLKDAVGYGNMNLAAAALSLLTALLAFFYIEGKSPDTADTPV